MSDTRGVEDKRQQDFDDLQRELAGQDVGRIQRFMNADNRRDPQAKRDKDRRFQDLLDQLLLDPIYRALYQDLGQTLDAAERSADQILEDLTAQIADMQRLIEEMEADAARGPDGQPVFRYADGRVVNADGEVIPIEIAAGIQWPDDAPSAEDYFAAKDDLTSLQTHLAEWQTYRTEVLGDVRDRYDDTDKPMSKGDLQDALDGIAEMRPELSMTAIPVTTPSTSPDADLSALEMPMKLN